MIEFDDDQRRERQAIRLVAASLSLYVTTFVVLRIFASLFSGYEMIFLLPIFLASFVTSVGLTTAAAVIREKWLLVAAFGQAFFALFSLGGVWMGIQSGLFRFRATRFS